MQQIAHAIESAEKGSSLPLVLWPDRRLTQKAKPVTEFDDKLAQFIIDMMLSMKTLRGLGLSACQVGDPRAVLVYKVDEDEGVMINPELVTWSTSKHLSAEGCLSFPGAYVKILRWDNVTVHWYDETGAEHEQEFTGRVADCIQHEIDHLNGKVFLETFSRLKKDIVTRKMKKIQKRIERMRKVDKNAGQRMVRARV